jgi:hypothetical protein
MPISSASGPIARPLYDRLVESEDAVQLAVPLTVRMPIVLVAQSADVLLTMSRYHGGSGAETDSPDQVFSWWASERARQAPFSLRAAILLWDRGHYVECVGIIRQLLESFVQLRYFHLNRQTLKDHLMATRSKGRVPFKAMFEAFSPGFYDAQYGALYSNVAHSGMAFSAMMEWIPATEEQLARTVPRLRCEFRQGSATFAANVLVLLARGFLKQYPNWFAGYTAAASSDHMEKYRTDVVAILENCEVMVSGEGNEAYLLWKRLID